MTPESALADQYCLRPEYRTRKIRLIGVPQVETAIAALKNAPIDPDKPLELVLREEQKTRKLDANAAMWAGPLKDIEEQAWVDGRQYSAEVWHEFFKREYLPEDDDPELPLLAVDGYRKWDHDPSGERVLMGTTTKLTPRGMSDYMNKIQAHGASLGVIFHAHRKEFAA